MAVRLPTSNRKRIVNYRKTEECTESERFTSLPDEFILHDAEVCWGELAEDIDVYFETEEGFHLYFRESMERKFVLFEFGGFQSKTAKIYFKAEKQFIDLLRESITMEY